MTGKQTLYTELVAAMHRAGIHATLRALRDVITECDYGPWQDLWTTMQSRVDELVAMTSLDASATRAQQAGAARARRLQSMTHAELVALCEKLATDIDRTREERDARRDAIERRLHEIEGALEPLRNALRSTDDVIHAATILENGGFG